jgi:hypothetical protein
MTEAISEKVLHEILHAYAQAKIAASRESVEELAAAAGQSEQDIMNAYATMYHLNGGFGDPWGPPTEVL